MSKTAYSVRFARELDIEQLAGLLNSSQPLAQEPELFLSSYADFLSSDLQCPCCGKTGARIVSAAKARSTGRVIRQAHFRFVNVSGDSSHHPFCDFFYTEGVSLAENLVNFLNARSDETRAIRELVCRGIEKGLFSQQKIRALRQWFFDIKLENQITVTAAPRNLEYIQSIDELRWKLHREWKFHPAQADMPNFNWSSAAKSQFLFENKDVLEKMREIYRYHQSWDSARTLIATLMGRTTFNPLALRPYYESTLKLWEFLRHQAGTLSVEGQKLLTDKSVQPSTAFLAFSALIMFVSDWELNDAISVLAKLFNGPKASDLSLGNVIGLNPFHDYGAWSLIRVAEEVATQRKSSLSVKEEVDVIEARLKGEYQAWKNYRLI